MTTKSKAVTPIAAEINCTRILPYRAGPPRFCSMPRRDTTLARRIGKVLDEFAFYQAPPVPADPREGTGAIRLVNEHQAEQGQADQVMKVTVGAVECRMGR